MKKLLSVCLALVMVISFGVTALAEGGFVSSPSGNPAPEIVKPSDGKIVITPYSNCGQLSEAERKNLEAAYNSINGTENLVDLNRGLKDIAKDKNIDPSNLAVSDLFNVSNNGASGTHTLELKADTFKNFVALMVYVNGEWKIVDDAKLQGTNLVFTANYFGPYAVVVNTADDTKSPQTGINEAVQSSGASLGIYGALMLVSACGALLMWKKSKKYSA